MTHSRNSAPTARNSASTARTPRKRRSTQPLLPATAYPPPMQSKYRLARETEYQILLQRHLDRNEKARVRMARRRAALKAGPPAEQQAAAEREREYQNEYRIGHRQLLRDLDLARRLNKYRDTYGPEALDAYMEGKAERRRNAKARRIAEARRLAKEPYDSDHDNMDSGDDDTSITTNHVAFLPDDDDSSGSDDDSCDSA
ncbi:hypothetical protein R3P38DRAFT_3230799 [Favolaschia claudopus]|uniref:Uncharacterized protein n=1 Tax=Favolaschia claudopus TaxID=2862362 RepID=A0AAV9ZLR0_9AGAR